MTEPVTVEVSVDPPYPVIIGTGLLARSMTRIFAADLGFKRDRLIVVDVSAWRSGYEGDRRRALRRPGRQASPSEGRSCRGQGRGRRSGAAGGA